jgi:Zn ribbon nucleic-acid-binding protein
MKIDIYLDHVIVEGQTIKRPSYISRGQWLKWWETSLAIERQECVYCGMVTKR